MEEEYAKGEMVARTTTTALGVPRMTIGEMTQVRIHLEEEEEGDRIDEVLMMIGMLLLQGDRIMRNLTMIGGMTVGLLHHPLVMDGMISM